jgi:hypothetical protein
MSNDKECEVGYEEFMKLLTPDAHIINGEFIRSIRLET